MDIDNLKQIARLEGLEPEELREKYYKQVLSKLDPEKMLEKIREE